jgi:tetratricopeptide (TPR) repeat protein
VLGAPLPLAAKQPPRLFALAVVPLGLAVVLVFEAIVDDRGRAVLERPQQATLDRLVDVAPWRAEASVGRVLLAGPGFDEALASAAVEAHPEDGSLLRVMAGLAARAERWDLAQTWSERALRRDANDYRAWWLAAILERRRGDDVAAATAAARAMRQWPRERVADKSNMLETAWTWLPESLWWLEALEDAPAYWSMRLAWLLMREGEPETALLAAQQAARIRPEAHTWSITKVDALAAMGRVDEIEQYVSDWRVAQPEHPWMWVALSRLSELRPATDRVNATTVAAMLALDEPGVVRRCDACVRACAGVDPCWCDAKVVQSLREAWLAGNGGDTEGCERVLRDVLHESPWLDPFDRHRAWSCAPDARPSPRGGTVKPAAPALDPKGR